MEPANYPTEWEIGFITRLGCWKKGNSTRRLELLQQYIDAAEHRVNWNGIDREKVLAYARNKLHAFNVVRNQGEKK